MGKTVYIVLFTLSTGGAERHASSIANFLSKCGDSVKILLLENNIVDYPLDDGVEVVALSDMENATPALTDKIRLKICRTLFEKEYRFLERKLYIELRYQKKLEYFFSQQKETEQSTVISFMTIPNIITSALKKKFKYKLVLGEFTSPQLEFSADAPENRLKRMYYPNADGFVFQTYEQQEFYTYLQGVEKKVIPNPIEDISVTPFVGKRRKEIVNFCKHVRAKNLPLLIDAFARLVREYPDYTLVIYGDGPGRSNTEKCIAQHGIADKVILKPYAKNVLELIRESAMFVSSSDREGISNSMLEAMAIGLPTVCTDCPAGGARMFIDNYRNGLLVPVRDPEALYKAMKYIVDNPDEAEIMGKNAVEIRKKLEKSLILKQWLDFLNGITGETYERDYN